MNWKSPIWEELLQKHTNNVVTASGGHLSRASAVTLSVSKSASSSHHHQTGSFQSHRRTTMDVNARNAENGFLSWLMQHRPKFGTFRCISTKLDGKVYRLFCFNCLTVIVMKVKKVHAKICTNCWNIDYQHKSSLVECYFFILTL